MNRPAPSPVMEVPSLAGTVKGRRRRRPPERNVPSGETTWDRLRHLRHRVSIQQFVAELLGKRWSEPAIPLALLVGVIAYFSLTVPSFTSSANLLSTGRELSEFAFVCLGMTLVLISGGIDLSVGAIFGLSNTLVLILIKVMGLSPVAALMVTVAAGVLMGAANGAMVAYLKARPFLTTMVTLVIFRGVLSLLDLTFAARTATVFIDNPFWTWLGTGNVGGVPTGTVVLLVVFGAGHLVLSRSRLGWHVTAVGTSRRAARHAGIRVEEVLLATYVASGALAAFSGILYAARLDSASSRVGEGMEFVVLTAVVLGGISLSGGRGTVWRALIGAGIVGLLSKGFLLMNVEGSVYTSVLALVLLTAVGADVKWAKNRAKAIQKIYVNPTIVEYDALPSILPGSGTPYEINTRLQDAEAIGLDQVEGPEDVILDRQGRLYCGSRQGWILRFSGEDFQHREVFARTGGHPLGLAFDKNENLIVCVAGMGLYSVAPDATVRKLTDQAPTVWWKLKDSSRIGLADDCDVASDGTIYFSELTIRFDMHDWILDGLEGRPNGRLLSYNPTTEKTQVVLHNLVSPNGVCCCHDEESLLIAQTWLCRIIRYWHSGPQRGRVEVFVDNLPGYLDNINRSSDGGYWVALNGMRSPMYDLTQRSPEFRRRMMKRIPRDEWLYPSMNHGFVLKLSGTGEVLDSYWDPGAHSHATITSMREHEGYLYLGGLENNRVGRIKLSATPDREG